MSRVLDGKTSWRTHPKAMAGLLIDGRDYFYAFQQAASTARKSICLLGWQFDSDVLLLRGSDLPSGASPADYHLLAFLDRLCRERPELEIRVLAWDHSFVFALEREVLQKLVFDVIACERFQFRWDGTVPLGGSHHQKLAIIDGRIAFSGSQDLAQSRWDESSHLLRHPHRKSRFDVHSKPYHEVQCVVTGAPVRTLLELFVDRWADATGEELDPASLVNRGSPVHGADLDVPVTVPLSPSMLGVSRTMPAVPGREPTYEVRELVVRALREADHLVYIETQYLTSRCVRDALVTRMSDRTRPKLDIVIVMPHKLEKFKEEFTIGVPQATLLEDLEAAASAYGHRLGVYNVATVGEGAREDVFVYIHAKLMIVDDRFMTVGSANLTNRSMTIDSELNLSWEALPGALATKNAIRRARVRLLCEHVGATADVRDLAPSRGLVARLDAYRASGRSRLRRHDTTHEEPGALARKVQELACEVLDPLDGAGPAPVRVPRPSAA